MTEPNHYIAPTGADRAFNAVVRWLTARGVNIAGAQTLTVLGRRSGEPHTVPVNPLKFDDAEYVVAVRGDTEWARNARAAGTVELGRGRRVRTVALTEVPAAQRAPILAAYLSKWGWEVGRFLPDGIAADASVEELATVAQLIPVFVVR